jgi:hypothetical protein
MFRQPPGEREWSEQAELHGTVNVRKLPLMLAAVGSVRPRNSPSERSMDSDLRFG